MPYNITHTDGSLYATIGDGVLDNKTGLSLVGRNYHNYGELIANNFLALLENQSKSLPPTAPVTGQLWWDKTNKVLNVYDGNRFKPFASSAVAATAPAVPVNGDQWWDTTRNQLTVFNGTTWLVVGPVYSSGQGESGVFVNTVADTSGAPHTVSLLKVNGNTIATISSVSFFDGVTEFLDGITLAPTAILSGTATNATSLGNIAAANYVRTDVNNIINSSLTVTSASGVTIGNVGNVKINGDGFGNQQVLAQGGSLFLLAGNSTVQLDSITGELSSVVTGVTSIGVTNKGYVDTLVSTSAANLTLYVNSSITSLVSNAQLSTLNALSNAIGNDASYYINTNAKLATKANINSPQLTGIPLAPTATVVTTSDQVATTAFVKNAIAAIHTRAYVSYIIGSTDVTTGRQALTYYTNNAGNEIEVCVTFTSGLLTVEVNGTLILSNDSGNKTTSVTFAVPNGAIYICSGATLQTWVELR